MALHWEWDDKCGELYCSQIYSDGTTKDFTVSLYQGNACLIMLNEFKDPDTGENMWTMWNFFADKDHMKRCLGLAKLSDGTRENCFDHGTMKINKLRLNKAKNRFWKDIILAFAQAFNDMTIEVYLDAND